jgi:hypothetical protein
MQSCFHFCGILFFPSCFHFGTLFSVVTDAVARNLSRTSPQRAARSSSVTSRNSLGSPALVPLNLTASSSPQLRSLTALADGNRRDFPSTSHGGANASAALYGDNGIFVCPISFVTDTTRRSARRFRYFIFRAFKCNFMIKSPLQCLMFITVPPLLLQWLFAFPSFCAATSSNSKNPSQHQGRCHARHCPQG